MSNQIYVRPVDGASVPNIDLGVLELIPEEGAWVERSFYIERRLMDGELVECQPPDQKTTRRRKAADGEQPTA